MGTEFTAAAVAAGIEQAVDTVEAYCEAFARREQFVEALSPTDWPDGTVTARYRFRHDLYRESLYERVPVSRRVRWHRQIGRRLEAGYGPQAQTMAAELAAHFVRGRDPERAVPYLRYAGEQAVQRSAHHEALQHFTQGLALLATLPETLARTQQELALQVAVGPVLIAMHGPATPEVERTYARAHMLCTQVGETPELFPTLRGLCWFYMNLGPLSTAQELGTQLLRLAQRAATPTLLLVAQSILGGIQFHRGAYAAAWGHLGQALPLIDPAQQQRLTRQYSLAPGVICLSYAAHTRWCLGYPAQALRWQKGGPHLCAGPHPSAQSSVYAAVGDPVALPAARSARCLRASRGLLGAGHPARVAALSSVWALLAGLGGRHAGPEHGGAGADA